MQLEELLQSYNYPFSQELIAQEPASPRDSAKLLVYDRASGSVSYDTFLHLAKHLPAGAVIVFNQTKVVPARLIVRKPRTNAPVHGEQGGGLARIIYLETCGDCIKAMSDRKLAVGSDISLTNALSFRVERQEEKYYYLKPSFPMQDLFKVLYAHGEAPLPPYIKNSPLSKADMRKKYQAVFAQQEGSVAAPTASLHFTPRLLASLKKSGIETAFVTLHVGLGTFAPLEQRHIDSGKLHQEWYEIDSRTARLLNEAKRAGRPIIAVGTTVTRTLESAADSNGVLEKLSSTTDLFIREGYRFKFVDSMITNFHVPQSSLLMLVGAFAGKDIVLGLYEKAASRGFKFFSFGDGMLIV
jgi:S-adenosylmethionine:tRNA ribosyltransferase-isomerase